MTFVQKLQWCWTKGGYQKIRQLFNQFTDIGYFTLYVREMFLSCVTEPHIETWTGSWNLLGDSPIKFETFLMFERIDIFPFVKL